MRRLVVRDYSPCDEKTTAVMRPSETFNAIIDGLK